MIETKLPDGALISDVKYVPPGQIPVPYFRIPFQFEPSDLDVRATAETVARFVSERNIGLSPRTEQQEVIEVKPEEHETFRYGVPDTMYLVQHKINPELNIHVPNYRVVKGNPVSIKGIWGFVTVFTSPTCVYDEHTLEALADSVKYKE